MRCVKIERDRKNRLEKSKEKEKNVFGNRE